jgi:hypothetical protein
MSTKLKVGDKVRIVECGYGTAFDDIGAVVDIVDEDEQTGRFGFKTDGLKYDYKAHIYYADARSFELVETKQALVLTYGGTSITLDPNIEFSRRFAEVFLNVVYGEE